MPVREGDLSTDRGTFFARPGHKSTTVATDHPYSAPSLLVHTLQQSLHSHTDSSIAVRSSCQHFDHLPDAGDLHLGSYGNHRRPCRDLRIEDAVVSRSVLFLSSSCSVPCKLVAANDNCCFRGRRRLEVGHFQHPSSSRQRATYRGAACTRRRADTSISFLISANLPLIVTSSSPQPVVCINTANMSRTDGRHFEESYVSDRRRSSVMSISALLNNSDSDPERVLRTSAQQPHQAPQAYHSHQAQQAQQAAWHANNLPVRSRTNLYYEEELPATARGRAGSSSTESSDGPTSPHRPRRLNRPKYSDEEEAFIWFHRVDLREEWDTIVHAFNRQFPRSHRRHKSGLECKLYRVLVAFRVPQIRGWRKPGDAEDEEMTYYGITEWTSIRYPWMGPAYWPLRRWH